MIKWGRLLYQPNLPLGENGRRVTGCHKHISLSKNAAKEGMVLLKNDNNMLPFTKGTKLALFGKGVFDYVKGGGGSGDVTVSYIVNLYEGLRALAPHVQLEENLASYYCSWVRDAYRGGAAPGMVAEPELPDDLCVQAREFTDTALIALSRFSGEGWDRGVEPDRIKVPSQRAFAERSAAIFEQGDFYLSNAERAMIEKVKKIFPKVAVVLNVGGAVDTEWFYSDSSINSVLLAWQGGMEGGRAAAELLCGFGNPSGKLSDTFAKRLEDYPSTIHFHDSDMYVEYTEDIYVGYRYFETLTGATECVNYPFGFGLSYTKFDWSVISAVESKTRISIKVCVKNIGPCAGKEVIQVYASPPQGLLGKPAKNLVAFKKTKLLAPNEKQLLTLSFEINSMASYDDLGKIAKAAYVLEEGIYNIFVGTSVRDVRKLQYTYTVSQNKVTEQLVTRLAPACLSKRLVADGSYESLPQREVNDYDYTALPPMTYLSKYAGEAPAVRAIGRLPRRSRERIDKINFNHVAEGTMSLDKFVSLMTDEELAHLLGGQPNTGVANTWGFGNMPEYYVPNAMTADGPAGLRIKPECGIKTTAFPCATLLACTWNPQITFSVGVAAAKEVKENNIAVWLAPAVNIHRSPLCGRNFEYYSEDPYLTGVMAASLVKGIQSQHIAPAVKHFAFNNKETNRKDSDSRVSERAAREIYLKAFEIIVKTAKPWIIMSAYNLVNGYRTSECRELLDGILREEWGFDGIVCTDWWTYGEHYKETKAGNDLKMASGYPERLMAALELGVLTREELEISAKRILSLILKFD